MIVVMRLGVRVGHSLLLLFRPASPPSGRDRTCAVRRVSSTIAARRRRGGASATGLAASSGGEQRVGQRDRVDLVHRRDRAPDADRERTRPAVRRSRWGRDAAREKQKQETLSNQAPETSGVTLNTATAAVSLGVAIVDAEEDGRRGAGAQADRRRLRLEGPAEARRDIGVEADAQRALAARGGSGARHLRSSRRSRSPGRTRRRAARRRMPRRPSPRRPRPLPKRRGDCGGRRGAADATS